MTTVIRTEKRKRGFVGWIFLIIFWLFNILMLVSLFAGINGTIEKTALLTTEAEKAGAAVGTVIGVGMILTIWALGAAILGLFVVFTRGSKVTVETSKD